MSSNSERENPSSMGEGQPFRELPKEFKPGALYTTPDKLCQSGLTRYSINQIHYLHKTGQLPGAFQLGRQIILLEEAVDFIINRDQSRASGELKLPGVQPGTESKKRGRKRLTEPPHI